MPLSPVSAALVLCALALPLSIAASNVALGLLALALLARARGDRSAVLEQWRREPLLAALAAYAGAGLLSAALCPAPAAALKDSLKDLHRLWSLGLFTAALAVAPDAPLRPALAAAFAFAAVLGVAQTLSGVGAVGPMVRAHAFVHPVVYGEQMALAALGGACVLLRPTTNASRRAAAAFTVLTTAALILSQTRMALLSAFLGFMVVGALEPRARRWMLPALGLLGIVGAAWQILPTGGRTILSIFGPHDPRNPQHVRWFLWDVALRIFRDHPWTGAGPGGFHRLFSSYFPGPLDGETDWASAHNLYLHQLAERGLAGAAALLAVCGTMLARAVAAARRDADTRALWAAGAVTAFLAMSLTETSFQNEQFSALLLLVWAWGTVSLRHRTERL